MKSWHYLILGVFTGLLAAGLVLLLVKKTGGQAVILNPPPTPAPLIVYVTGAVIQPGVYTVPITSRVNDAILAAGGPAAGADVSLMNLAAPLNDGERIWVPNQLTDTATPSASPIINKQTPESPSQDHPLNINTATQVELETLPGIGPSRAQQIIAYRTANGFFMAPEDLLLVDGISNGIFSKIKDLIAIQPQP
jgi:competence protein ComEA